MRIALFGANGPTGRRLIDQSVAAGHQVVAVTRHPEALPARPGVSVVAADVADGAAVSGAVAGVDAVASVLGGKYSRSPVTVYSTGARTIVAAMREHRLRRLVVVSSAMVGSRRPAGSIVQRRLIEPLLREVLGRTLYADMIEMERLVSVSDLDWTIIRPSALCDSDGVTDYLIAEDFADHRFTSRSDLAASVLAVLADPRFVARTAAVVSPSCRPTTFEVIMREASARRRG